MTNVASPFTRLSQRFVHLGRPRPSHEKVCARPSRGIILLNYEFSLWRRLQLRRIADALAHILAGRVVVAHRFQDERISRADICGH